MSDQTVQAIREQLSAMQQVGKLHPHDWRVLESHISALLTQHAAEGQALREERDKLRKQLDGLPEPSKPSSCENCAQLVAALGRYHAENKGLHDSYDEMFRSLQDAEDALAQLHAAQAGLIAELLVLASREPFGLETSWLIYNEARRECAEKLAAIATPAPTKEK